MSASPITFARIIDVNNAAELYEFYASLGHHLDGDVRETTGNTHAYVKREPIGVVAAITPFNFPLILSSSKIAPALIAGNTIVHKPASDTPLSALIIADILQDGGPCPTASSTSSRAPAQLWAISWSATRTSTRSPSPGRPRSAPTPRRSPGAR